MTLTLSPEIEKAWTESSVKTGRSPDGLAEEKEQSRQEALALIRSGYFRDRLSSSDEFSARKAEEKALEERQ